MSDAEEIKPGVKSLGGSTTIANSKERISRTHLARSQDRFLLSSRRHSVGSGDLSLELNPVNLTLNVEPLNPCGCCYLTKREDSSKLWGYINLTLAIIHMFYKWWVTLMLAGGTFPNLRAYAVAQAFFCTKTNMALTARGYCFDVVSQLIYVLGSILFLLAVCNFKEFKPRRKLFVRIYMAAIFIHMIGAYAPQTLFWFYDGHCIPPGGMSVCEKKNSKGRVEIVTGPYADEKSCFPLTHLYFIITYVSSTVAMFSWWVYGLLVAHSHLFFLRKTSGMGEEETPSIREIRSRDKFGSSRKPRDRNQKLRPSVLHT